MSVFWNLNGGGFQGGNFGILEYLSQGINNFCFIEEDLRYKYFDDASIKKIVNLLSNNLKWAKNTAV